MGRAIVGVGLNAVAIENNALIVADAIEAIAPNQIFPEPGSLEPKLPQGQAKVAPLGSKSAK
jgi:hypothetical protein